MFNKTIFLPRLRLSAVLSGMRIPAGTLAGFGGSDRIETAFPEGGVAGTVTFKVDGAVVAKGELQECHGRLLATITWVGDDGERRLSEWQIRKNDQKAL